MQDKASVFRTFLNIGWIAIIIFAIIGALTYFDIVKPDVFMLDKCKISEQIKCIDYTAKPQKGIELTIKNDIGYTMTDISVSIMGDGCRGNSSEQPTLEDSGVGVYTFPCNPKTGKLKADITVKYTNNLTGATNIIQNGELVIGIK